MTVPADPHHTDEGCVCWDDHMHCKHDACCHCGCRQHPRRPREGAESPSAVTEPSAATDSASDTPDGAHGHQADTIRARLEAATPGPWQVLTMSVGYPSYVHDRTRQVEVCRINADRIADARFIAHAPADVAWLLAALDDMRSLYELSRHETAQTRGLLTQANQQADGLRAELARVRAAGDELAAAVEWAVNPERIDEALAAWKDAQP